MDNGPETSPDPGGQLPGNTDGLEGRLDRLSASVDTRFAQVDRRFQDVDRRFDEVDRRFDEVRDHFVEMREYLESGWQKHETRLTAIEVGLGQLGQQMKEGFDRLENLILVRYAGSARLETVVADLQHHLPPRGRAAARKNADERTQARAGSRISPLPGPAASPQ